MATRRAGRRSEETVTERLEDLLTRAVRERATAHAQLTEARAKIRELEEPYKTAEQVAFKLGYSIDTIYDWAQAGKIPVAFRAGGQLRFDLAQVVAALKEAEKHG